jgi:hypothetical protein
MAHGRRAKGVVLSVHGMQKAHHAAPPAFVLNKGYAVAGLSVWWSLYIEAVFTRCRRKQGALHARLRENRSLVFARGLMQSD